MTQILLRFVLSFAVLAGVATHAQAQTPVAPPASPGAASGDLTAPFASMAAPKSPDNLAGSLGFGVGVVAGNSLIATNGALKIRYWLSDTFAVAPELGLFINKTRAPGATESSDATWGFAPKVLGLFVPWQSTSTRFNVGAGLGIGFGVPAPGADTEVAFTIPVYAGVEHLFTRWFSMGIGLSQDFIYYRSQQGDAWTAGMGINTTTFDGYLMFYTD